MNCKLIGLPEHEFSKGTISIDTLKDFANIHIIELNQFNYEGAKFLVPPPEQF